MSNYLKVLTTQFADTSARDQGVDISHHDPVLKPAESKTFIGFAIMKLTEGTMFVDSAIDEMWKGVKQVDVRGGYHYQRSGFSWEAQAKHFLKIASWFGRDLHVYALDLEPANNNVNDTFFCDTRRIINYWRTYAPVGHKIVLYTNWDMYKQLYYALRKYYPDAEQWLAGLDLWYSWPTVLFKEPILPSMRKTWTFWQKSWTGKPEDWGTESFVDVNEFNGTHQQLLEWAGITPSTPPIEPPDPPVVVEPPARPEIITQSQLWDAIVLSGKSVIVRTYPLRVDDTATTIRAITGERFRGNIWPGNGYVWMQITSAKRTELINQWVAVRLLDGSGALIKLNKVTQDEPTPELPTDIYRVMKWGDPILVKEASRTISNFSTVRSNFQAIGVYNKATNTMGGVSNWLRIPHTDVMRLAAMQVEDNYVDKIDNWRDQKMRWLVKGGGTIYFHGDLPGRWDTVSEVHWGTIALGNNLVKIVDTEIFAVKTPDGVRRTRKMAKLAGFRASDWSRSLEDLVANGLVHRCYCVYGLDNTLGDSPKGICWSPFWSPLDWDFGGGKGQPDAFWLPMDWLIKQ